MQDYEQYTRISRAPVILPPVGTPTDAEEEKEPIPQQDTQPEEEQQQAQDHSGPIWQTIHLTGGKGRGSRLLLVQTLVCVALLLGLLLTRSAAPEVFEGIRSWYAQAMSRVITVSISPPEQAQSVAATSETAVSQAEISSEPEASSSQAEESSQPVSSAEGEG